MSGDFLLDTNIVIDIISKKPSVAKFTDSDRGASITTVVLAELYYGTYNSKKRDANLQEVENIARKFSVIDANKQTAEIFGQIKSDLKRKGQPVPDHDI